MIEANMITGFSTAIIAGLLTSVHCAGMCGPLVCILTPKKENPLGFYLTLSVYQIARILSITLVGALLGALGKSFLNLFEFSALTYLPWSVVFVFLLIGLGVDKWLPKPRFLSKGIFQFYKKINKMPRMPLAFFIGALTPLIPCGPLYLMFFLALSSGSASLAAQYMLGFGIGTLPLLFMTHAGWRFLTRLLGPVWMGRTQRVGALLVALLLSLRLISGLEVNPDHEPNEEPAKCPMCVH